MKLIPDWRSALRFASVQAALLLAVLSFVQATLLPMWQFAVPANVWPWLSAGFGTVIALLRLVAQPSLHSDEAPADAAGKP